MVESTGKGYEGIAFSPLAGYERPRSRVEEADVERMSREQEVFIGFLQRLAAYLIDSVLLLMLLTGVGLYLVYGRDFLKNEQAGTYILVGYLGFLAFGLLYYWLSEALFGSTVGKWALRIRVVKHNGQVPGAGRALVRNLMKVLELSPLLLNGIVAFILILAHSRKKRLGDMAAGTVVLPVNWLPPLSRRRAVAMRTTFIVLSAVSAISLIVGLAAMGRWLQDGRPPQSYQTLDGRYELTVPANWHHEPDAYNGVMVANFWGNNYIYMEVATDEEWNELETLEDYLDYVQGWMPDQFQAELDDKPATYRDLNGNEAYRFTMHGRDEEGNAESYAVTVTGDGEQYYFIMAMMARSWSERDGIESFRKEYRQELDKLDRVVESFKPVHQTVTI